MRAPRPPPGRVRRTGRGRGSAGGGWTGAETARAAYTPPDLGPVHRGGPTGCSSVRTERARRRPALGPCPPRCATVVPHSFFFLEKRALSVFAPPSTGPTSSTVCHRCAPPFGANGAFWCVSSTVRRCGGCIQPENHSVSELYGHCGASWCMLGRAGVSAAVRRTGLGGRRRATGGEGEGEEEMTEERRREMEEAERDADRSW